VIHYSSYVGGILFPNFESRSAHTDGPAPRLTRPNVSEIVFRFRFFLFESSNT